METGKEYSVAYFIIDLWLSPRGAQNFVNDVYILTTNERLILWETAVKSLIKCASVRVAPGKNYHVNFIMHIQFEVIGSHSAIEERLKAYIA